MFVELDDGDPELSHVINDLDALYFERLVIEALLGLAGFVKILDELDDLLFMIYAIGQVANLHTVVTRTVQQNVHHLVFQPSIVPDHAQAHNPKDANYNPKEQLDVHGDIVCASVLD
jgi:hypothetical protein